LDPIDDGLYLLGRRPLFHHDHHLAAFLKLNPTGGGSQRAERGGVRHFGCRSTLGRARPDA
jgi:hypothetical protein